MTERFRQNRGVLFRSDGVQVHLFPDHGGGQRHLLLYNLKIVLSKFRYLRYDRKDFSVYRSLGESIVFG